MSADPRRLPTWRGFTGSVFSVGPESLPRLTRAAGEGEVCKRCQSVEWDEWGSGKDFRSFTCRCCGHERHERRWSSEER